MICQICGKDCDGPQGLTSHAFKTHGMTSKDYYDRFIKKPDEGICSTCGKPTEFIKFGRGYKKHCSYSCSSSDPKSNEQRYNTYELYNDRSKIMSDAYKRYKERTGYAHPSQNPEIKLKKYNTKMSNYFAGKIKLGYVKSKAESEIVKFIKTFYNGSIYTNTHKIIPPKELDIYFPELNKAIEYNGTYWHADPRFFNKSDLVRTVPVYEIWEHDKEKQILCETNNIKLLTIWEYDYNNKYEEILEEIRYFISSSVI